MHFVFWPASSSAETFSKQFDVDIQHSVKRWWPDLPSWKLWKAQLYQESKLNPKAVSPVGARGLAQFMPATWNEVAHDLNISGSAESADAIEAGAYYMAKMRKTWKADRTALQRNDLAAASYNAGTGSILKAQAACHDARLWPDISPCLVTVTGDQFSRETRTYVERIAKWWHMMEVE